MAVHESDSVCKFDMETPDGVYWCADKALSRCDVLPEDQFCA